MKGKDVSKLLERYEQMLVSGKVIYFDADEYDELADYYDKLDDIETAKEIIELGLRIHPNNESLMLRHVRFLTYDADYTEALHYLNIHFSSYDFEQYLLKIECLLQLGLYAEAHQLTVEVLKDDETETELILSELGFLYVEAEYFDEAILYFEKSLEYDSKNIEVLNDLAYAYEVKGDFESATSSCERILDINPYSFDAWLMSGKLYLLQGVYGKAIDAFDFALTLDEENVSVLKLKAHCFLFSNKYEEAIDILLHCLSLSPEDKQLYFTLADSYQELEDYNRMYDIILEYESKSGESADSIAKKALVFFLKGDLGTSETLVNRAMELEPDSYEVNKMAGDLYAKLERFAESENFYQKALSIIGDTNEEVLEKLVSLYVSCNNFVKAIEYQKRLYKLAETPSVQKKLALLYLEIGDKENFKYYASLFDNETLVSFFQIFYPEEQLNLPEIDRDYILRRLEEVYEYRILYKNIKY